MPHPHRFALLAFVLLSACADDTSEPDSVDTAVDTDQADASVDISEDAPALADVADVAVPEDTTPDSVDATEDSGAVEDVEPDAEPVECPDDRRAVGDLCRRPFDRSCYDNSHCREDEECEWRDGEDRERPGTCMVQLPDTLVCPGSDACPTAEGPLRAGFSARNITPTGWELPREGWTEEPNRWGFDERFVGDVTDPTTFCDCGRDLVCPPTEEFADCLSLGEYVGPDADGTEGDGFMQGAWIAGFGNSRAGQLCPEEWLPPACEEPNCCTSPFAHTDIWARTVVIDKGDTRIAWVNLDLVGFFASDIQLIAERLDPALGIDWVLAASTHTHEAPDTIGQWGPGVFGAPLPTDTGAEPVWMEWLRTQIVGSIEEAVADLAPVDIYAAHVDTGPHEFAIRDTRDPFIFDDRVTILRFVEDGVDPATPNSTRGVMVNWHSHPEAIGSENVFTSSDFPHFVRHHIENGFAEAADDGNGRVFPAREGLGGIAIYASGSVGGLLNPLHREVVGRDGTRYSSQSYGKARALGQRLADLILETITTPCENVGDLGCLARIEDESLAFATEHMLIDVTNVNFQAGGMSLGIFDRPIFNWRSTDGNIGNVNMPKLRTAVTQLRIGGVIIQTFPGEPFPELTLGVDPETMPRAPIIGDWQDMNCAADRLTRLAPEDEGERFGCMLDPNNRNPPDLSLYPPGEPLATRLGGDYLMVLGLANDQLGYLVPPYDFKVDPNVGALLQVEGDHYEETVSAGDMVYDLFEAIDTITLALE